METDEVDGGRVRALRTSKGWSQDRLAREIEMTKQAIWEIETGRTTPKVGTLQRLAAALGVDLAELLVQEGAVSLEKAANE